MQITFDYNKTISVQKQSPGGVPWKRCSRELNKFHRKTPTTEFFKGVLLKNLRNLSRHLSYRTFVNGCFCTGRKKQLSYISCLKGLENFFLKKAIFCGIIVIHLLFYSTKFVFLVYTFIFIYPPDIYIYITSVYLYTYQHIYTSSSVYYISLSTSQSAYLYLYIFFLLFPYIPCKCAWELKMN